MAPQLVQNRVGVEIAVRVVSVGRELAIARVGAVPIELAVVWGTYMDGEGVEKPGVGP